jgi:glycerol-3-phosphate dehydrogenase
VSLRRAALARVDSETFDLLVIGGGITGVGIARDAALRGLSVVLVERRDFASGTSSRSSRLIHGGVRYLEHGYLQLVFESSRERRTLLRIAPHLVQPLRFTWPVYRGARIARWRLRAGLTLYDALALFRNVAPHRRLSARDVVAEEPALASDALVGGAQYYDAATDDARLTLATALSAIEAGAAVLNYVEVASLRNAQGRVTGAVLRDRLSGSDHEVTARTVVNATGPWSDTVSAMERPGPPAVRGTKGAHILVPRDRVGNRGALTLLSPIDGRVMFALPSRMHTVIGTTDTATTADPDAVRATADDVAYLLRSINAFFPAAKLSDADVISAWAGIRPLAAAGYGNGPASASREHAITLGPTGMLSVTGGKLTTYRAMAAEVVNRVERQLGRTPGRSRTATVSLPGGGMEPGEEATARGAIGDREVAARLVGAFGSRWRDVWRLGASEPTLRHRVVPVLPFTWAEVRYAVSHELALTLSDVLMRRVPVAFETGDHAASVARNAARVMAPLLDWTDGAIDAAVNEYASEVDRIFRID